MHVQMPLLEKDMVTLFAKTFKSSYYKYLISSSHLKFCNVIMIAERIEQWIQARRILEFIER